MKSAIVVGGAGFVGSAVVKELLKRKIKVYVVVRPGFSKRKDNKRLASLKVEIIECDLKNIADIKNYFHDKSCDVWYQFAWDGLFNADLLDYHKQIANIEYVMNGIKTASEIGCKKFIGAGSISQYELEITGSKVNKNDKHQVYKTAKLSCEYMGYSVAKKYDIDFFWPIITNIYGVGETSPRLINSMIRKLLSGKHQSLSEGNQIYDFIYIDDAARAFASIGEKGIATHHYVIGSGEAKKLKKFLIELRDVVSPNVELGFGEMEFNGIYLDKDKYDISELTRDTSFKPLISFKEGIRLTSDWIKKNN